MQFVHCVRCGQTVRSLGNLSLDSAERLEDDELEEFLVAHRECPLRLYTPTGRGEASAPWHDPMATRRIEVHGEDGLALMVGSRRLLDEPLVWRLEPAPLDEESNVVLDRSLYWLAVDRALSPCHLPLRALEAWARQIENFAGRLPAEDIVVLDDDPARPGETFACLTLTAKMRLEKSLRGFGFDSETERRLETLFDETLFPPLRVRRHFVLARPSAAAEGPPTQP